MTKTTVDELDKEVTEDIDKTLAVSAKYIKAESIKPIAKGYDFSSNGFYLLSGRMGAGKTLKMIKHILMCDKINDGKPYYRMIAFCSTSNGLDQTVEAFANKIKTPLMFIPDTALIPFLKQHIRTKKKFYAMYKWIDSNMKLVNNEFKRICEKHNLKKDGEKLVYVAKKIQKYNCQDYPANLLLILDDFANHPLLKDGKQELSRLIRCVRHLSVTVILAMQSCKGIIKDLRRIITDIVIWKGASYDDWEDLMHEVPHQFDDDLMWEKYNRLTDINSYLEIHLYANTFKFVLGPNEKMTLKMLRFDETDSKNPEASPK